jgi:hypothetical protein
LVSEDFADPATLVPDVSGVVHWPQNLKWGGFSERHLGQMSASAAMHCPQNFIPPGFSKPHFQQRIVSTRFRARRTSKLRSFQWALPRRGLARQCRQRCSNCCGFALKALERGRELSLPRRVEVSTSSSGCCPGQKSPHCMHWERDRVRRRQQSGSATPTGL